MFEDCNSITFTGITSVGVSVFTSSVLSEHDNSMNELNAINEVL